MPDTLNKPWVEGDPTGCLPECSHIGLETGWPGWPHEVRLQEDRGEIHTDDCGFFKNLTGEADPGDFCTSGQPGVVCRVKNLKVHQPQGDAVTIAREKWIAGNPVPLPGHAPAYYDLTDAAKTAIAGKVINNKKFYPIREEAKRGKMFTFGKMTIIFTPELYSKAIDLAIWEGYVVAEQYAAAIPAQHVSITVSEVERMLLDWAKLGGADPGREWSLKNNNLADAWGKLGQGKAKEQRIAIGATQEQRATISRAIEDTLAPKEK